MSRILAGQTPPGQGTAKVMPWCSGTCLTKAGNQVTNSGMNSCYRCCCVHVVHARCLQPAIGSGCCNAICIHLVATWLSNCCLRLCAALCAACSLSQPETFACCKRLLSCCSAHLCWHVVPRAVGALVWDDDVIPILCPSCSC